MEKNDDHEEDDSANRIIPRPLSDQEHAILMELNNLRQDLEAARREVRGKARIHDKNLNCLKAEFINHSDKYVSMLDDITERRRTSRKFRESLVLAAAVLIMSSAIGFVALAIWNHFKHLVAG